MIRLLLLLVALGAGATAIVMFFARPEVTQPSAPAVQAVASASQNPENINLEPAIRHNVLVTSVAIDQGVPLTEGTLEWSPIEDGMIRTSFILEDEQPDALERATQLVPMVALDAGEPLRWERLQPPRPTTLSARLSSGMRAVAVAVSPESTAGGFVLPEDHVDVLLVGASGSGSRTQVVVSNVRVVALDQTTVEDVSGETFLSSTATLELNPTQMEAVITARDTPGRLVLALRSMADGEEPQELYTPPQRNTIRVIRDGRVEEIEVSP